MRIICIDTGTEKSGVVCIDDDIIESAFIVANKDIYFLIATKHLGKKIDLCIIEMITLFGGRRKSSHIAESIVIVGKVMQIFGDLKIPIQRISRTQVVHYFTKGLKKEGTADKKIQRVMRERLHYDSRKRHPFLKYDLWQAYALYQFAKEHNFEKWYVPNFENATAKKLSPEERMSKQKKYLEGTIKKNQRALDAINNKTLMK